MVRASHARELAQQVRCVAGTSSTPRTDQRMGFVDEQDNRPGRRLHFIHHLTQAVLELPPHAGASLQQPKIERTHGDVT